MESVEGVKGSEEALFHVENYLQSSTAVSLVVLPNTDDTRRHTPQKSPVFRAYMSGMKFSVAENKSG